MSALFQGTRIGTLTVANRFVRSATVELLGDDDGRPLPELSAMYRVLAKGGGGAADLISLCRPLIREPDLPNRIRNGQDKATCISCFRCWPQEGELGISCHYRPETS